MSGFAPARPPLVVDASVAVEALQGDTRALALLAGDGADLGMRLVPPHFWLETANTLVRARESDSVVVADLRLLAEAGLESADRGMAGLIDSCGLARKHRLTVYDAAYLQLALDVEGELATLDRALAKAAVAEGVVVRP